MNELLELYNHKPIKIYLFKSEYNAQLINVDNKLFIQLTDYVNHGIKRKIDKNFKFAYGKIEDRDITFFGLYRTKIISKGEQYVLTYLLDSFVDGMRIANKDTTKKVKTIDFEFYSIPEFSNMNITKYEKNFTFSFPSYYKTYDFDDYSLLINIGATCGEEDRCRFYAHREILFKFSYKTKVTIDKVILDIAVFRNFLSLTSKRKIGIERIELNQGVILFMNFLYYQDKSYRNESQNIHHRLFLLTLEDLSDNFELVYKKYLSLYDDMFSITEIYYDLKNDEPSKKNVFLNYTQILEEISKKFDSENVKAIRDKHLKNNPKRPENVTLSDRLESIINQVKNIWGFRETTIEKISSRIARGRNYYIHHKDKKDELNYHQLTLYSFFLEDVFIGYIYLQLDIPKKKIKEALDFNIYFPQKKEIIKISK